MSYGPIGLDPKKIKILGLLQSSYLVWALSSPYKDETENKRTFISQNYIKTMAHDYTRAHGNNRINRIYLSVYIQLEIFKDYEMNIWKFNL